MIEAESELDIKVKFQITANSRRRVNVNFPQPDFFAVDDGKHKFNCPLKFQQFPIHVNNATAGHKLQGTSLESLMISSWSYARNWPCVMLSRVRTLQGLFLRDPLKHQGGKLGKDYSVPKELTKMQQIFEKHKIPIAFSENFDEEAIFSASSDLQHSYFDNIGHR